MNRYALLLVLALTLAGGQTWARTASCAVHFAFGQMPESVDVRNDGRNETLCFSAFAVLHSGSARIPLWSAEYLDADRLAQAKTIRRVDAYHPEERLPRNRRAELEDYARSGFDRGHLSPSADMPDAEAQLESFSLANIVPQNPDNNQNLWAAIEDRVRGMARQRKALYVITGPLLEDEEGMRLNRRVTVPSHLFKAVYDPQRREGAAYVAPNRPGDAYETLSLAELERRAGINLFPAVADEVKQRKMELPQPRKTRQREFRQAQEPRERAGNGTIERWVERRLRELQR